MTCRQPRSNARWGMRIIPCTHRTRPLLATPSTAVVPGTRHAQQHAFHILQPHFSRPSVCACVCVCAALSLQIDGSLRAVPVTPFRSTHLFARARALFIHPLPASRECARAQSQAARVFVTWLPRAHTRCPASLLVRGACGVPASIARPQPSCLLPLPLLLLLNARCPGAHFPPSPYASSQRRCCERRLPAPPCLTQARPVCRAPAVAASSLPPAARTTAMVVATMQATTEATGRTTTITITTTTPWPLALAACRLARPRVRAARVPPAWRAAACAARRAVAHRAAPTHSASARFVCFI